MNLFIFFALPLATILLSIVLQKILKSPMLVAITFFAIYLIVAFVAFVDNLAEALIAAIIYAIIAYITAYIIMIICRINHKFCSCRRNDDEESINQARYSFENNNEDNNNIENIRNRNFTENQSTNRTNIYGNMINRSNMQTRCYRRV